ncbi:MAG: polyphosphate polymerase domain-containing protein [Proteobacteria bacterium]|nr:polyphosphate polymerase domain-containing protein [Pseudomonadota bacterium]
MSELILEFSRFEFKYVLHRKLREAVESELGYFMQLDPFVEDVPGHRYTVRSLYFDDPHYTAFYDKIDGLKQRSKFRVRTYTKDPTVMTPVFLEEKGRYDNRVFKHRVLVGDTSDENLCLATGPVLLDRGLDNATLEDKFRYQWFRRQIRPIALIDYERRPYVSKYDHEFRVTFDERLYATETDKLFPGLLERGRHLLPGYTVMEVKFDTRIPAWFHRILQSHELRRVPLSKICEGMKTLKIATDL